MLLGVRLVCCLLLPLLQRGHGDAEYRDLEDEGYYVYLDEDGVPEVLAGAARCQDTYQDWISLYCWVPFHAALMAAPKGSRCRWDQINSLYSELSGCTQLLAQLLSCPWPSAVLDAFFLQVHAEYFTNCTGAEPPQPSRMPPAMAVAAAVGLSCLVPLAAALTLKAPSAPSGGSSSSSKEQDRGAPTLQPPERQGLMASRRSCLPVKGPAVPRSSGSVACGGFGGSGRNMENMKPGKIIFLQQGGSL